MPALHRCLPEIAFAWIDQWPPLTATETLSMDAIVGRHLAQAVLADADEPPEARSAGDGYAVQAAATEGASDYNPLPLSLNRQGPVSTSSAVPVQAGETLPAGADAVLPLELAEAAGKFLEVAGTVSPGEGVIQPGEEYRTGETLLAAGRWLRPQDLGWLALAGVEQVTVYRQPRVRVILAGEYSREVDGRLLSALLARDGGELDGPHVAPSGEALRAALQAPGVDLMLVAGSSGLGDNDQAVRVLDEVGELAHHGVAIHPGDSAALGQVKNTPVVVLPGAPLGCLCAYELLACRLLRRLVGHRQLWPYHGEKLPLTRKIASRLGRLEICRVRVVEDGAEPLAISEARLLRTMVEADGMVLVPVQCEGFAAGSEVMVYRLVSRVSGTQGQHDHG